MHCVFNSFLLALFLVAATSQASAQDRYKPSPEGDEITDSKTGLVWQR